ncbi:DJ-1 family glyoxalase III [Oceanivirga salmonicida]|uniref:DJ-1 family glyoxalase III n=1 Tax=Oceanivirga salmonicida TaxID=1769291 RepID=UPI00082D3A6D|nr:DJ-1 family glyoxalase III [Oceanivirga salmonicida]
MKVVMTLVKDFELLEAVGSIDMLRRADIDLDIVSVFNEDIVMSYHNVGLTVDKKMKDIDLNSYDMLILPGGAGTVNYFNSKELMQVVKEYNKENKYLAAICAAPSVLAKNGVLNGKNVTAFPSVISDLEKANANVINKGVVVDGKIITGQSAAYSIDFGLTLVETILGKEKRIEIEKSIIRSSK